MRNFKNKNKDLGKNEIPEENTFTCMDNVEPKKEILNKSWDKIVIEVSVIYDRKELWKGKLNPMCIKSFHFFFSNLLF